MAGWTGKVKCTAAAAFRSEDGDSELNMSITATTTSAEDSGPATDPDSRAGARAVNGGHCCHAEGSTRCSPTAEWKPEPPSNASTNARRQRWTDATQMMLLLPQVITEFLSVYLGFRVLQWDVCTEMVTTG